MIALFASLALGGVGLDRVDVLSLSPGTWLVDELPRGSLTPRVVGIRFVEQIQPVLTTPIDGLTIELSLGAQNIHVESALIESANLSIGLGLNTQLLLPRGAFADVSWRHGPVRLAAGATALSSATWSRIDYGVWRYVPGLSVGFGRPRAERAVWMR